MASRTDLPMPAPNKASKTLEVWNRKGHYYLGLYFVFFLWLFAFTGLLLNHSWKFAEFWPNRTVTKFERAVRIDGSGSDLARARQATGELGLEGEIEWTETQTDPKTFKFRVSRPGRVSTVAVKTEQGQAAVEQIDFNAWGTMRVLHTFTGARREDTRNERDWILTTAWVVAMDALSIGLIAMVLSGVYMWWQVKTKRGLGAVSLLAGCAVCALFVFGLRLAF